MFVSVPFLCRGEMVFISEGEVSRKVTMSCQYIPSVPSDNSRLIRLLWEHVRAPIGCTSLSRMPTAPHLSSASGGRPVGACAWSLIGQASLSVVTVVFAAVNSVMEGQRW